VSKNDSLCPAPDATQPASEADSTDDGGIKTPDSGEDDSA
jgi:hypothetical protein